VSTLPVPALPLDPDVRRGLELIAELILPGTATLPAGVAVGAHAELLDRALTASPRLVEPVTAFGRRAAEAGAVTLADLQAWSEADCEEVVFALTASYYMAPEVLRALGYPGQMRRPIAEATPEEKQSEELLAPVIARGPAYVPTPELGES
jgi:hypothetical protein